MRLAGREDEGERQAVGVAAQVQLGREAAARAAQRLAVLPPLAPAACWWARTRCRRASARAPRPRRSRPGRRTPPRTRPGRASGRSGARPCSTSRTAPGSPASGRPRAPATGCRPAAAGSRAPAGRAPSTAAARPAPIPRPSDRPKPRHPPATAKAGEPPSHFGAVRPHGLALADIVAPAVASAVTAIDIGQEAGLPAQGPLMGESAVFDQDGDGDRDILLSTHGGEWPLLRQGRLRGSRGPWRAPSPTAKTGTAAPSAISAATAGWTVWHAGRVQGDLRQPLPEGTLPGPARPHLPQDRGGVGRGRPARPGPRRPRPRLRQRWRPRPPGADRAVVRASRARATTSSATPGGRFVDVTSTPLRQTITAMNAVAIPKPSGYPDVALETEEGVITTRTTAGRSRPAPGSAVRTPSTSIFAYINGDGKRDSSSSALLGSRSASTMATTTSRASTTATRCSRAATPPLPVGRRGRDRHVRGAGGAPRRPGHRPAEQRAKEGGLVPEGRHAPKVDRGHGDVANPRPRGCPGGLGDAVLVTKNKWLSGGSSNLGPPRLVILKN